MSAVFKIVIRAPKSRNKWRYTAKKPIGKEVSRVRGTLQQQELGQDSIIDVAIKITLRQYNITDFLVNKN